MDLGRDSVGVRALGYDSVDNQDLRYFYKMWRNRLELLFIGKKQFWEFDNCQTLYAYMLRIL